jgi:hypothetical protein
LFDLRPRALAGKVKNLFPKHCSLVIHFFVLLLLLLRLSFFY